MKLPNSFLKKLLILFNIILCCTQIYCKPPVYHLPKDSAKKIDLYHVNYPVVSIITGIGLIGDYFAIGRIKGKSDLSDVELAALNTDIINPIDRWALRQDASQHKKFSQLSDYSETGFFLLPVLLVFDKNISKEWGDILMMYVEGHIITFTFYNYSWLGPTFQNKYRPLTYYSDLPAGERMSGNNRNSFYSGHVASVAYSSFFMAKVYSDYHPDMGFGSKILLYTAAVLPPALVGYLRVKALAHFPSDDLVGFTLGAAIGVIIPELHKRHIKNLSLGMVDIPGGMGLSVVWTMP